MLFFYMLYKYFFVGRGGGVVNLYCTLLTRKKGLIEMFSTQLKTRTHLEFSLDKDNKVREQYSIVFTLSLLRLTLQREEVLV